MLAHGTNKIPHVNTKLAKRVKTGSVKLVRSACGRGDRAVCRALSAIWNNRVSAFQGEVYTGRLGPIVGTLESVRIIEMSTFQGCPQGGVPLYVV